MTKIVIDPGHGGMVKIGGSSANNAVGPTGLLEKAVTLDLALQVEKLLAEAGHTVVLTRKSDVNLGLAERAAVAKAIAAPVFVSIHLNGFNNRVQGTETLCDTVHQSFSGTLCRAVQKRMVAATGHTDRNKGHPGGVKVQTLGVLKQSAHHKETACVLVECSFMDVAAEEARLKTKAYLGLLARALADGIGDYLEVGAATAEFAAVLPVEDGFAAIQKVPRHDKVQARVTREAAADTIDRHERPDVPVGGWGEGALEFPGDDEPAFDAWVKDLNLRYFSARELRFLGASNAPGAGCAARNQLPPPELWPAVAPTARMLDEIHHRIGPCRILSGYRSPTYNACIGGESASYHMKFNAIDFQPLEVSVATAHAVARSVRLSDPAFLGGIGKYPSFVHIDTRGYAANW